MASQVWKAVKMVEQLRKKLRKPKTPSGFNRCIGTTMYGKKYKDRGEAQQAFRAAAKSCRGKK